jgi:hypothetical protein
MAKKKDVQDEAIGRVLDDLRRVFQVVHGYSKRAERVGGLTGPQLWAVKILDRLESGGLVQRTRSTEDRRVVTVSLTDKGNQLVAKTPEVAQGLLLTGLRALPNRELHAVETGLSLLVEVLGAQELPPRLLFSDEVNAPVEEPSPRSKPGAGKIP